MASGPRRAEPLGDQLAGLLRARIVTGELAGGTHLVEEALAADHDVSRGPVRDALKSLLAEGLLESRRRGFFVRDFTRDDVEELYAVRGAIEQLAGELAIAAVAADWSPAERAVQRMQAAADAGDWRDFAAHDLEFHSVFYRLSGNRRLAALWNQYRPTFAVLLDVTNSQDADLHPSADDHAKLLRLARSGDRAQFAAVLSEHLAGSKNRMCTALQARWADRAGVGG